MSWSEFCLWNHWNHGLERRLWPPFKTPQVRFKPQEGTCTDAHTRTSFFWFLSDLIWGTIWPCLQYCLQSWERGCFATRVAGWTKNTVGWVTFGGDQSSYGSIRWITKYCDNLSGRLWAISAYRKLRKKTSTMPCVSFCGTEIWFQRFESPCCKIRKSNPPRSKSVKLTTICLKMTSILFISPPKNGSTLKQS